MPGEPAPGALTQVRVLDLTDERGIYCAKLLADLGADVIRAEPPGGDPLRRVGPFVDDIPGPNRGLPWLYLATNRRSLTLDLTRPEGQALCRQLAARVDVVLESFAPGQLSALGLGYDQLRVENPGLVFTAISGFGQTGPWRDWRCDDLTAQALGGLMSVGGDPDSPPVRAAGDQAYKAAGLFGAIGTLLALNARRQTGRGQQVDVALHNVVASIIEHVNLYAIYGKFAARRQGTLHWSNAFRCLPTRDGEALVSIFGDWETQRRWYADIPELADLLDERWCDDVYRITHGHEAMLAQAPWVSQESRIDLFREAQARRLPWAAIDTPAEVCQNPQLLDREFFVPLRHDDLGRTIVYPGAPYKLSRSPHQLRRPAPQIGEHSAAILSAELGQAPEEAERLGRTLAEAVPGPWPDPAPAPANVAPPSGPRPLEGLRVVDFTWVLAGPFAAKILALHGAEVIKIEVPEIGDRSRRPYRHMIPPGVPIGVNCSGYFNNVNPHKYSVTLNLKHPRGLELARQLILASDLLIENFSARVMRQWGLDWERLRAQRPDLILVSMAGLGQTGPWRDYVSYGPNIQAWSGLTYLTGFPERGAVGTGYSISDHIGGLTGALGALAALAYRDRTGEGQHVDVSQLEATTAHMGVPLLEWLVNGRELGRVGNRDWWPLDAPQGVYRCAPESDQTDRWCAISVRSSQDWDALVAALGQPAWTQDSRFASPAERIRNQDALDALVEGWTRPRPAEAVMARLQAVGLAAGVVQNGREMVERDPQLRHRGFFEPAAHGELGEWPIEGMPLRFSESDNRAQRAAPLLGEHNEFVFRELLGLSDEEFALGYGEGVF